MVSTGKEKRMSRFGEIQTRFIKVYVQTQRNRCTATNINIKALKTTRRNIDWCVLYLEM